MFQPNLCNRCHDLLMMSITLNIAILNIKAAGYCCIIRGVIKGEAINLIEDIDLTEKKENLKIY